jgi:hypothetical protein
MSAGRHVIKVSYAGTSTTRSVTVKKVVRVAR